MAKFLTLTVNGATRIFSAENIITCERTAATTTTITYCTGSTSTDILTLTHSTDAGFATGAQVVDAVRSTIIALHDPTQKKVAQLPVTLPTGVTVSTAVLA